MAIGRIPEPGTGIPESIVDAKGDIVTATAADTPARLAVGTNEQRLVADSGETTGLKYVADTTNYAVAAKGDLLVGTAADTVAVLSVGTDGFNLVADSSSATGLAYAAPAGGGVSNAVFIDEKPSGTDGGTFTSGAWRTRDINTTQFNDITSASISSNQITLPAGTYKITAYAPAFGGDRTRSRFYNVTDSAVAINGLSAINNTGTLQYINIVEGLITIASSKTFELQHIINVTQAGNGFGVGTAAFSTPEVYSTVSIMKVG